MTATATYRRPLVPEDLRNGSAASIRHKEFWRAITAKAAPAKWQTRTAVAVATTANTETLGPRGVGPIVNLAPQSVAAKLAAFCVSVDFRGVVNVLVQKLVTQNGLVQHIGEGGIAQMVALAFDPQLVGPLKKFLFGCPISDELRNHSLEAAIPVVERSLSQIATTEIDGPLLDTAAMTEERPAGLLHNVTAITATANGGIAALAGDLSNIVGKMDDAKIPTENLVLVGNRRDVIRMQALLPPAFPYTIVGSSTVAAKTLIGIAPSAVAMYISAPEVEASDAGPVIHMDSSATDFVAAGGQPATGGAVASAFQRQLIVYKCRLSGSWGALNEAAVQVVNSVSW